MKAHPAYAHAPLVFVVAEVRHPESPTPLNEDQVKAISRLLRPVFPLQETTTQFELELNLSADGSAARERQSEIPVFRTRDQATSVTIGPVSFSLETTRYTGWSHFRRLLAAVLEARLAVARPAGLARLGLRYVDDIRVPAEPDGSMNWARWIDSALVAGPRPGMDLHPLQHQSVVVYGTGRVDEYLILRHGTLDGAMEIPGRPAPSAPGPFFCLDTDAAWQPSGELPELDAGALLDVADRLHEDVRDLFESALTDDLRSEVLGAR